MRPTRRPAAESGFTIVESMIAMFILAFMVGEMGTLFVYATRNTNLSQSITRANQLADETIEKNRNIDYEKLQLAVSYPDPILCLPPPGHPDHGSVVADGAHLATESCSASGTAVICTSTSSKWNCANRGAVFTRTRTVQPRDAAGNPVALNVSKQADVNVVVGFSDARGNVQRVAVTSVISEYY